jgi:hypothetical protein
MTFCRSLLPILIVAMTCTGCNTFRYSQVSASASNDLNGLSSGWVSSTTITNSSEQLKDITFVSYLLSNVQYSIVSPTLIPTASGPTTAVVVNFGGTTSTTTTAVTSNSVANQLNVIEFGQNGSLTNTGTNSGVSWANQLATTSFFGTNTLVLPQSADVGNDSILGWGRWTDPIYKANNTVQTGCCSNNISAHYVYGAVTPDSVITSMPLGGAVQFSFLGATSPTVSDGSSSPGTLSNTSTVGVAFGGPTGTTRIGVSLTGSIGGSAFTVASSGGSAAPASSLITYSSSTQTFTGATSAGGTVSGFFAGPTADHIGLTYSTPKSVGSTVLIQGAAAFIKK